MHIVMNNFKIKIGREEEFEEVWRNRDSYLEGVPGFLDFHLIKGHTTLTIQCMRPIVPGIAKSHFIIGCTPSHFG